MSNLMVLAKECDATVDETQLMEKVAWARNNPGWMKSMIEFNRLNTAYDLLVEYRLKKEGYPRDGFCIALVANNVFVIDDVYFDDDIRNDEILMFRNAVAASAR